MEVAVMTSFFAERDMYVDAAQFSVQYSVFSVQTFSNQILVKVQLCTNGLNTKN
jgi:hypothetical protein